MKFKFLIFLIFLNVNSMSRLRTLARVNARVVARAAFLKAFRLRFPVIHFATNNNSKVSNELTIPAAINLYRQYEPATCSPALYKSKSLDLFYIEKTVQHKNKFTISYTGTSTRVSKNTNARVVLIEPYNKEKILESFSKLTRILKHEVIRDMTKIGNFFTDNKLNPGEGTYSSKISNILDQLPNELRTYYSNLIQSFVNDPNIDLVDCIEMYTKFTVEENNKRVITQITTDVVCNLFASKTKDCCHNCKNPDEIKKQMDIELAAAKKESMQKAAKISSTNILLLPEKIQNPYEVLQVGVHATEQEIKKNYFEKRLHFERQNDTPSLKKLDDAYKQLNNKD